MSRIEAVERQNPVGPPPTIESRARPGVSREAPPGAVWRMAFASAGYFKTESLKAFEARSRTTVLALILIGSPVFGLRPMRALR